jgi:hypothetical protein
MGNRDIDLPPRQRHAGHMDIVRELIGESAGLLPGVSNMPPRDRHWWLDFRARVEPAAKQAARAGWPFDFNQSPTAATVDEDAPACGTNCAGVRNR